MAERGGAGKRPKYPENSFCGMLIIRKEPGYTSSDVVAKLRGILHMRRIGHTGTLDPMAEGVLPVCLGSATKLTEFIADRDKEYVARLRLGVTTDTQDMTGTVLEEKSTQEVREILLNKAPRPDAAGAAEDKSVSMAREAAEEEIFLRVIRAGALRFTGEIEQIPPMYSAVWSNGKRLYDLARKGVTVERESRKVTIPELEVQSVELPYVMLRIVCSKGTYIRTLCEDLGNALGTGGAMDHLLRTRVGDFTLDEALTLDEVQSLMDRFTAEPSHKTDRTGTASAGSAASSGKASAAGGAARCEEEKIVAPGRLSGNAAHEDSIGNHIIPVDRFFSSAPAVHVREEDLKFLTNGNPLSGPNTAEGRLPHAERIRVYDERGEFYAVYRYEESRRRILPVKMFHETDSVNSDRR